MQPIKKKNLTNQKQQQKMNKKENRQEDSAEHGVERTPVGEPAFKESSEKASDSITRRAKFTGILNQENT